METAADQREQLQPGELALDFVNSATGKNTAPSRWEDSLVDAFATLTWLRERKMLSGEMFRSLMHAASSDQVIATDFMNDVHRLREALGGIFRAIVHHTPPPESALETLNLFIGQANAAKRLTWDSEGFHVAHAPTDGLARALWPIVESAEALLTSARIGRVKECASSTCEWLFLDTSKNNSRRWCRMDVCGNREKGRRRLGRERAAPVEQQG